MSDARYSGYGRPDYPDDDSGRGHRPGYGPPQDDPRNRPPRPQANPPYTGGGRPYGPPPQRQPYGGPPGYGGGPASGPAYGPRAQPPPRYGPPPQRGGGRPGDYRGPEGFDGPGYGSPRFPDSYRSGRPDRNDDQEPGRNGFAVAGFVMGLLGNMCGLGWVFSIVGLVKAKRARSGKGLAWFGLIFSTAWVVVGWVYVYPRFASGVSTISKRTDAGCVAFQTFTDTPLGKKDLSKDDAKTMVTDLAGYVSGLQNAAAQSSHPEAKAAINKLAADFQALHDAVKAGKQPPATLQKVMNDDAAAVDAACGNG